MPLGNQHKRSCLQRCAYTDLPSEQRTSTFCIPRELERVGPGGGDDSEDICVYEVPLADVDAWLAARGDDVAVDPKIYAGLWLFLRSQRGM